MKSKFLFLLCLNLFNVFVIQAQQKTQFESLDLSEIGIKSYQRLVNADTFSIGGIGYAGMTSSKEISLHFLLKEKQAAQALELLSEQATPEGRLYALFGLRIKDANLFVNVLKKYKYLPEPPARKDKIFEDMDLPKGYVRFESGCMTSPEKWLKIIERIEVGEFDKQFALSEREAANLKMIKQDKTNN